VGADFARQQGQHVGTWDPMTEGMALGGKQVVKLGRGDVVALEEGPCVGIGVCGVHLANKVEGEAFGCFVAIEGFKWAREDDSSEIPENGTDFLSSHG